MLCFLCLAAAANRHAASYLPCRCTRPRRSPLGFLHLGEPGRAQPCCTTPFDAPIDFRAGWGLNTQPSPRKSSSPYTTQHTRYSISSRHPLPHTDPSWRRWLRSWSESPLISCHSRHVFVSARTRRCRLKHQTRCNVFEHAHASHSLHMSGRA